MCKHCFYLINEGGETLPSCFLIKGETKASSLQIPKPFAEKRDSKLNKDYHAGGFAKNC